MHENNSVLFVELAAHETLVVLSEVGKMLASGDWRMPVEKGKCAVFLYLYFLGFLYLYFLERSKHPVQPIISILSGKSC